MTGKKDAAEQIAELLEKYGKDRKLKVQCTACGLKMDLTKPYPFEIINCPGCHSDIRRPAYFGDYLLKENLPSWNPLTSLYLAADLKLERDILVSILNPELAANEKIVALFLKTARVLAVLKHPSAIPIYNCGETAGLYFIAFRKTGEETLEDLLESEKGTPVPFRRTVSWMRQIVSALKTAEESNLCHGVLSPRNLLPEGEDSILISGFGLGALCKAAGIRPSSPCTSPESGFSSKSDLYSAGAILFRLLAGRYPESGERDLPRNIASPDPRIAGLLRAMLEKDPSARISPANALVILEKIDSEFKSNEKKKKAEKTDSGKSEEKRISIRGVLLIAMIILVLGTALGLFFLLTER